MAARRRGPQGRSVIAFDVNVFVTAHVAGQEHHVVALEQIEGADTGR